MKDDSLLLLVNLFVCYLQLFHAKYLLLESNSYLNLHDLIQLCVE